MLNGGADVLVPLKCNERFVERLRPLYARFKAESNLILRSFPGVGHQVTAEMQRIGCDWLNTTLLAEKEIQASPPKKGWTSGFWSLFASCCS